MLDTPPHVNPPKQSRSRRTLERIVRASLDILDDEGPDGLTVQAVVARAGSSVGSFYARFQGKDELLDYLGERVWQEAAGRWDRALASREWGGLDLRGMLEDSVRLLVEAGRARASYLRALEGSSGARGDAYGAFHAHVLHGIEEMLLERASEIKHPEPAVGVPFALRASLAILDAPLAAEEDEAEAEGRRAQEALRLLLVYLAGERRLAGRREMDFFDPWG